MSIAETVRRKVAALPPARQQEVLAFVEQLERPADGVSAADPYGSLRDLATDLPLEEFQAARRQMDTNFPREL